MADKKLSLSRREFLKILLGTFAGTAGVGLGGFSYSRFIEPNRLQFEQLHLTLPRLPAAFNGYRLVQLSDIHMDSWMNLERLENIVQKINDLTPDCIVITGDFISGISSWYSDDLITALSKLSPKDSSAAVLGNHDHWGGPVIIRNVLDTCGISDVSNSFLTIRRGDAVLYLAGVDDYWERQDRLDLVLEMLPDDGCAILLAHEPDYADISAPTGRFDLQLSGHSHGGQVIIPFIGAPILPAYARIYPNGLYQVGEMLQYTNRGVGMLWPHVRFNCRPEITVFTLKSPEI